MDFMNLNQSAHGDREFGFITSRLRKPRKVVAGYWAVAPQGIKPCGTNPGGLPPEEFFTALDPLLGGFRARLFTETYPSNTKVGCLTEEWVSRLGLSTQPAYWR